MIDFKSVLGTLLELGLAPSATQRMGHAAGAQPQGGGGLGSILSSLAVAVAARAALTSGRYWAVCSAMRSRRR